MRLWFCAVALVAGCAASSGEVRRDDIEVIWSSYDTKLQRIAGREMKVMVPSADATPLPVSREKWLAAEGQFDILKQAPSVLLSIPSRLVLQSRGLYEYLVPEGAVQSIEHAGGATRAFWTINRPQGNDGAIASKLIVATLRPGKSQLVYTTSIGERRTIELIVE